MLIMVVAYLSDLPIVMDPIIPMDPIAVITHTLAILTITPVQLPHFQTTIQITTQTTIMVAPIHQEAVSISGLVGKLIRYVNRCNNIVEHFT